ncbi:MAG: fibronectin type III domain-containing protein [Patescibacteria group bacterium]
MFSKAKYLFMCTVLFLCTPLLTHAALTDNLMGFWNLNETSGSRASSIGSNTLTEQGGTVSSAAGIISNAALFTGANYLSITDNTALSSGNIDFTISGWVYLTDKTANRAIVSKWNSSVGSGREYDLIYISSSDRFSFTTSSDGTTVEGNLFANSFGSPSLNTWYFVTAWHDSVNDTVNIQVNNGTVDSASVTAGVFDSTTAFLVGSVNAGSTGFMQGRVDAVGFWKRVLSSGERTSLYNSGAGLEYPLTVIASSTPPSVPTSVNGTASSTAVRLSWTAPADGNSAITDYIVDYKATASSTWTTANDGVNTNTFATVSNLINGTAYDFRVAAVNAIGTGSSSATSTIISQQLNDQFPGSALDLTVWTKHDLGSNVNVLNGFAAIGNASAGAWTDGIETKSSYARGTNLTVEVITKVNNTTQNNAIGWGDYNWFAAEGGTGSAYFLNFFNNGRIYLFYSNAGVYASTTYDTGVSYVANKLYKVQILPGNTSGVTFKVYQDVNNDGDFDDVGDNVDMLASATNTIAGGTFDNKKVFVMTSNANSISRITSVDNVMVSGANMTGTIPSAINNVTAVRGNGKALLSWTEPNSINSTITDYIIEYKSGAGSYSVYADGTSAATTTLVTGLTNGTNYNFRVTAVNGVGTSSVSNLASTTPQNSPYYSIAVTGQSLSLGAFGAPALTVTQPYNNVMPSGGSLIPLMEDSINLTSSTTPTETINSALANSMTSLIGGVPDTSFVLSRSGFNGGAYSVIKKNGSATTYANSLAHITSVKNSTAALGEPYSVLGTVLIHGEADHNLIAAGGANTYAADILQLQSDYNTDIKAITGQSTDIPMFTDQMMSFTGYNQATSAIPSAQLAASESFPTRMYMVTPKYIFNYDTTGSQAHLINTSYRWLGEYYAKVMKKVLIDNQPWVPLSPKAITRNGNVIYARMNVPVGSLVIDTTKVDVKVNFGFEYFDTTSSATISSVELLGTDIVKVTLSGVPTGSNQRLRYAYTGTPGATPGAHISGSARGNIRDSDTAPSLYGNDLSNWLVSFDKAITLDQTPPVISNVVATPTGTSVTITWDTNEVATSRTAYGTVSGLNMYMATTSDLTFVATHTVMLTGLAPGTRYYYVVGSGDASSNSASSDEQSFVTSATPITTPATSVSYSGGGGGSTSGTPYVAPTTASLTQTMVPVYTCNAETKTCVITYVAVQTPATSSPSGSVMFTRDLKLGVKGNDVLALQQFLNRQGFTVAKSGAGSKGKETTLFGPATKNALIRFQKYYKIYPSVGFFGPLTKQFIKTKFGVQ